MPYSITVGHYQRDGSRWIKEVHTDGQGEIGRARYLGRDGWDYDAIATARNARILAARADQEVEDAVEQNVMPTLRFQTAGEFVDRVRALYQARDKEALAKVAVWMRDRILAADITEAQFQTAFGMDAGQWTTFKTNMQALANAYDAVNGAEGQ